ncbi:unnamed protein product [Leptosia nina]|uniref:Uncharacterized protein n=1 Tax=Leptosia nina TaxID=320188 RepID=A0AAV1JC92_9NEOP
MNFVCIVASLMILQVSASFRDELQGALHSVQHGFGKLLNDVVFDVTDTVHCTISAVEHVLTLNGLMRNKSPYGHKCRNGLRSSIDARDSNDPLENFIKTRAALEAKKFDVVPSEIHNSIDRINTTLRHAFENRNGQQKIESISKVLKDETEQLTKVSNMLRQELNSISKNVNTELEKFDNDVTNVWSQKRNRPNNNGNTREISGNTINWQTLQLHENRQHRTGGPRNSDERSSNQDAYNDAKREFDQMRDAAEKNDDSNGIPKNFRDVAQRERNKLNTKSDDYSGSIFNVDAKLDKFSPFYDPDQENSEEHKRVIDTAFNVIRDSERNEQIMEALKHTNSGTDVFASGRSIFNF